MFEITAFSTNSKCKISMYNRKHNENNNYTLLIDLNITVIMIFDPISRTLSLF